MDRSLSVKGFSIITSAVEVTPMTRSISSVRLGLGIDNNVDAIMSLSCINIYSKDVIEGMSCIYI